MPIWEKLKAELDDAARATQDALQKAGKVAHDALDEGKLRMDAFRARQRADRDAQAFGYAHFRARKAGNQLDTESAGRLYDAIAASDAEAARLEAALSVVKNSRSSTTDATVETTTEPPSAA